MRCGPTMEWDTAAGDHILTRAGGLVIGPGGSPLTYGHAERGYLNGPFAAMGDVTLAPRLSSARRLLRQAFRFSKRTSVRQIIRVDGHKIARPATYRPEFPGRICPDIARIRPDFMLSPPSGGLSARRLPMRSRIHAYWRGRRRGASRRSPVRRHGAADSAGPGQLIQSGRSQSYRSEDLVQSGHQFFGSASRGLALTVQEAVRRWGEPNGYILGQEASGAIFGGLRYGEGKLFTRNAGERPIFWQGPSARLRSRWRRLPHHDAGLQHALHRRAL